MCDRDHISDPLAEENKNKGEALVGFPRFGAM